MRLKLQNLGETFLEKGFQSALPTRKGIASVGPEVQAFSLLENQKEIFVRDNFGT